MIKSFRCRDTEALANDRAVRRFGAIERVARRKLEMLAAAARLDDLRVPPGNRLEALKADRKGQHSIRINDIIHAKRGISADTALRLATYFETSAEFWLNLQTRYDLKIAGTTIGDQVKRAVRPHRSAA